MASGGDDDDDDLPSPEIETIRNLEGRPPYGGASPDVLRKSLAALVVDGLEPHNVADNAGELLELQIVSSRVTFGEEADKGREIARAQTFIALVAEVVDKKRVRKGKYRRLLRYVLPLRKDLIGKNVNERRTAAGEHLTSGSKVVQPATIRIYYEPRALDELARVLVEMEAEVRGEAPPSAGI